MSVRGAVTMGRWAERGRLGRITPADRRVVQDVLDRLGLDQLANRQLRELSGGQRQRTLVGRGLAQRAALLLLDEPTAAADRESAVTIHRSLREAADAGGTVVVASHDPDITVFADRTVVLDEGKVVGRPALPAPNGGTAFRAGRPSRCNCDNPR